MQSKNAFYCIHVHCITLHTTAYRFISVNQTHIQMQNAAYVLLCIHTAYSCIRLHTTAYNKHTAHCITLHTAAYRFISLYTAYTRIQGYKCNMDAHVCNTLRMQRTVRSAHRMRRAASIQILMHSGVRRIRLHSHRKMQHGCTWMQTVVCSCMHHQLVCSTPFRMRPYAARRMWPYAVVCCNAVWKCIQWTVCMHVYACVMHSYAFLKMCNASRMQCMQPNATW